MRIISTAYVFLLISMSMLAQSSASGNSGGGSGSVPAGVGAGSALTSNGGGQPPIYAYDRIYVQQYGAKCDGSTDDTTAVNNALAAAVAVGTSTGTARVYFPAGICKGNFVITQGKGLKIEGSGELSTHLRSPNANPALQINGLWYSSFSDMTFDTISPAVGNAVLEIDGDYDGTHTQKVQFVTFSNILVSGVALVGGGLSDYAVAVCRQSGGNCQGSSLVFINPAFSGAGIAAYYQSGYNALGNQFIGGDFQFYTKDGMYILNGTINILGTTFETANGCAQLINGGSDIHISGGSFSNPTISGVRSEGWNLFSGSGSIDALSQNPAWVGYLPNHAFALNTPVSETGTDGLQHLYCATTAGTTQVGGLSSWPATGTVTDGTVVWTEENYYAVNGSSGALGWYNPLDSHLDATASLNWTTWSSSLGNYTLNSGGAINGGTFDLSRVTASIAEHIVQQSGTAFLDIYSNPQGSGQASILAFGGTLPASSVGIRARGGVVRMYLGDNLYEGTEGGTPATAQYHFTTPVNFPPYQFSSLPTVVDGAMIYCSDCTVTTPASCTNVTTAAACTCAGSGSGAFAKHINGAWLCN
jgi:hypothetical protein